MLSATMRSAVAQALRKCARGLPAKSLPSRVALVRRSFLVAPSYKSRVAVRGFATATASKTTGRTAAKSATKTKATPKAKATTTKAKKTAKAAAKPKKPVARKKKDLSPEKKELLLKRELKKKSLINREPKRLPGSRWLLHVSDALKGKPSTGVSGTKERMTALSAEFKSLSPAELERMDETVAQNKAINAGNFKTWVESHSISEIQQANVARRRLKREFDINSYPLKIHDERVPKRPAVNAYAYFVKAKLSADHQRRMSPELSEEWKALPAAEKKPYQDLAVAEFAKYQREMEKVYSP
ncbi:hypothetical protein F5883DRAFT_587061 [Diaporthe sp. PMI_573]|nr:hypothetical protein F5883DRAFT_587061 [Diaporthaceae sp. PMI_573]